MISADAIRALEFDAIARTLASRCETPLGEALALALAPLDDLDDALYESARVAEWSALIAAGRDVALSAPAASAALLESLAKDGLVLTGEEIAGLGSLLESAIHALAFLAPR